MTDYLSLDSNGCILLMQNREAVERTQAVALALQVKTGSAAAFDILMELEQRRVLGIANRLLVQRDDAADAVQEVFMRLYRHIDKFDPAQPWDPWIYRICVNVCRDINRKRRWRELLSLDAWLVAGGAPPVAASRADERTARREREEAIADGLKRLPEKERMALVLRDVEGLSAAEAANILGSREATVRSQASRARNRLREYLTARLGGGQR